MRNRDSETRNKSPKQPPPPTKRSFILGSFKRKSWWFFDMKKRGLFKLNNKQEIDLIKRLPGKEWLPGFSLFAQLCNFCPLSLYGLVASDHIWALKCFKNIGFDALAKMQQFNWVVFSSFLYQNQKKTWIQLKKYWHTESSWLLYIIDYVRYMSELRLVAGLFNPQGGIFRHGFTWLQKVSPDAVLAAEKMRTNKPPAKINESLPPPKKKVELKNQSKGQR